MKYYYSLAVLSATLLLAVIILMQQFVIIDRYTHVEQPNTERLADPEDVSPSVTLSLFTTYLTRGATIETSLTIAALPDATAELNFSDGCAMTPQVSFVSPGEEQEPLVCAMIFRDPETLQKGEMRAIPVTITVPSEESLGQRYVLLSYAGHNEYIVVDIAEEQTKVLDD